MTKNETFIGFLGTIMEEYKYKLECSSCEVQIEIEVINENELPCYCPMCGEDMNEEWVEQKED